MVTILSVAFTVPTGIEQERCTSPLMCTEQAPHCATPQPYLVPVRPTCSRMTHRSGVSASACTSHVLPLTLSFAMRVLSRICQRCYETWRLSLEHSIAPAREWKRGCDTIGAITRVAAAGADRSAPD